MFLESMPSGVGDGSSDGDGNGVSIIRRQSGAIESSLMFSDSTPSGVGNGGGGNGNGDPVAWRHSNNGDFGGGGGGPVDFHGSSGGPIVRQQQRDFIVRFRIDEGDAGSGIIAACSLAKTTTRSSVRDRRRDGEYRSDATMESDNKQCPMRRRRRLLLVAALFIAIMLL